MKKSLNEIYTELYKNSIVDPKLPYYRNCDKGSRHSYIEYYEELFASHRNKSAKILEIGVQGGISLMLWNEYFQNGDITGIDISYDMIQPKVLKLVEESTNIHLITGNATDPSILEQLVGKYDIIVDDGSHSLSDQLSSFRLLEPFLNVGGIYVIEDIINESNLNILHDSIPTSVMIDRRNCKNSSFDDMLILYRK